MKKVAKAKKRAPGKTTASKVAKRRTRGATRSRAARSSARKIVARPKARRVSEKVAARPPKPAAGLAARVLSRRAAASAAKLQGQPVTARSTAAMAPTPTVRPHKVHPPQRPRTGRPAPPAYRPNRELVKISRVPQFTYMKAPGSESAFNVGDPVEVFCDHELNGERVRGWVKGVVVQVDNKLVAVQFRSNVFLTDGWMVPDRILWYSLSSDQIRAAGLGKKAARKAIPEY
jgi:hypothetical protein